MIRLKGVKYQYPDSGFDLKVSSLEIKNGELVALTGPSGSGKSTLLKIISGQLTPATGQVTVLNKNLSSEDDIQLRNFRLNELGIFSQNDILLDYLNVEENIMLLKSINKKYRVDPDWKATVDKAGISKLLKRYPNQLSEGEKQRVTLCRTLSGFSKLILADEPTSSLDPANSSNLTELLLQNCRKLNRTLLMVTHDHSLLESFDNVLDMSELEGQS